MKDYYKLLGVDSTADHEVIKAAYRALARKYHPDVNKDPKAEVIFKLLSEAYETIGNPSKRKEYDMKYDSAKSNNSTSIPKQKSYSSKKTTKELTKLLATKFLLFLLRLIAPFSGILILILVIMLFNWICNTTQSTINGPTPSQPKTGQIPLQEQLPEQASQKPNFDLYADWDAIELRTGRTPDCFNFKPKYDKSLDNRLQVTVGNNSDVVVKLINASTGKCIRYVFISAGETYNIRNIPEGIYFTKIAYGKDWRQKIIDGNCKGKFVDNPIYKVGEERLDFNKIYTKDGYQIPSFELTLDVTYIERKDQNYTTDNITEDQFNE